MEIHRDIDSVPAPAGRGKLGCGRGGRESPHRRGRGPGGKTGRRLAGQGAGFVLRDHGSPGGLREASGGRTEVWEGQRDGDSHEGTRSGRYGLF